ncbi:MAG: branched-chain amino acid ABC transporter permease [Thermodesulfatator sp.]|nr:MAG: branched-chain amino acid ABC transporter permease [Thermodesulfatator sp.]
MKSLARDRRRLGWLTLFLLVLPVFLRNPYYLTVANLTALNVLTVAGLVLLIGYAGEISLGHAGFWAVGAYGSALLSLRLGFPPVLATLVVLAAGTLLAALLGRVILRLRGNYLVMATLAFNLMIYYFLVEAEDLTGGPPGLPGIPPYRLGPYTLSGDLPFYYLLWGVSLGVLYLFFNLVHSGEGRALRALSEEPAAACLGISPLRYKTLAFAMSAACALLAGALYAHYLSFISPKTFDIFFSVQLVTMCLFGGKASLWGALFGAGVLTPLPHLLEFLEDYRDLFYGGLLMAVLVFFPEGLSGLWGRSRGGHARD